MTPIPDPYRLLGVPRAATTDEIKAAHRALAKRYHPDAAEADTRRFLAVQEAYQLLTDPLRRREWDASHAPGPVRAGEGVTRGPGPGARGRGAAPRGGPGQAARGTSTSGRTGSAAGAGNAAAGAGGASAGPGGDQGVDPADEQRRTESGPWTQSDRDPATRSYTWSAHGVPWWEDRGPREARRPPGTKRPTSPGRSQAEPDLRGASGGATPRGPDASAGSPTGAASAPSPDPRAGGSASAPGPDPRASSGRPGSHAPNEFDVYTRSSGAAWSSASRAFFRRSDAELPRRGVFRMEGTTPVTGAAARRVADEEAARNRGPGARPADPPSEHEPPARPARPAASGGAARAAETTSRPAESRPSEPAQAQYRAPAPGPGQSRPPAAGGTSASRAARSQASAPGTAAGPTVRRRAPAGAPADHRASDGAPADRRASDGAPADRRAWAGPPAEHRSTDAPTAGPPPWTSTRPVVTGGGPSLGTMPGPSLATSMRAVLERSEPWPTVGERVLYATIAWIPLALAIGYGGAWISGCDRAAASCSPSVQPAQTGLIAVALLILALAPRLAYLGSWAAGGLALTGLVLAPPATILGNRAEIPVPFAALGLGLLVVGYLAGAWAAARDRPVARPWTVRQRRR